MGAVNGVVGALVGALLYPFRSLPPIIALVVVAVITGIAMLLVFKLTSNQHGIAAVKRRIAAGVFEIRLFNDDPRAIIRAQGAILRHTLSYLGFTVVPIAWMIIPLVLLLIRLQFYFGYGALEPGTAAIVKVQMKASAASGPVVALEAGPGVHVETPRLWIASQREAGWRIRAVEAGAHLLRIRTSGEIVEKRVIVSGEMVQRAPVRPSGFWGRVWHPVESALPRNASIAAVSVAYPSRTVHVLGWETHWLVVFFVVTVVAAFALQRPFRVTV